MRSVMLNIPQPCHESWAAMTPTAAGRHCATCQKTVVDFTRHTDAEILAALARATGETCGRLRPEQLGRPLRPLLLPAPSRWRAWLAGVVAVWGLHATTSSEVRAQSKPTQAMARVPPTSIIKGLVGREPVGLNLILRGSVIDSASSERIPGVSIILLGTGIGTASDVNGNFELQLPATVHHQHQIDVSFANIGHFTQIKTISLAAVQQAVQVKMVVNNQELSEMVVTGGLHYRRPWPWHPRALYVWTKYQLSRPFR